MKLRKTIALGATAAILLGAGAITAVSNAGERLSPSVVHAFDNMKKGGKRPDCVPFWESKAYNNLKYGGEDEPGEGSSWLNIPGLGGGRTEQQRQEAEEAWRELEMYTFEDGSQYGFIRISDEKICPMIPAHIAERAGRDADLGESEWFNRLAAAIKEGRAKDQANGGKVTPWGNIK